MAIHVVLVHPEIHWNTGNAGRTCLAVGAALHLVEPLGFSLEESEFECQQPALGEMWMFSTKGRRIFWDAPLGASDDVVLVFGCETTGLPVGLLAQYEERLVTMPMSSPHVRSINLSTSVGIATYETLRQRRARGA